MLLLPSFVGRQIGGAIDVVLRCTITRYVACRANSPNGSCGRCENVVVKLQMSALHEISFHSNHQTNERTKSHWLLFLCDYKIIYSWVSRNYDTNIYWVICFSLFSFIVLLFSNFTHHFIGLLLLS